MGDDEKTITIELPLGEARALGVHEPGAALVAAQRKINHALAEHDAKQNPLYECITIPQYPEYKADSEGNIWSLTGWRGNAARMLSTYVDQGGYATVRLQIEDKRLVRKVHRLVLYAFSGMPKEGQQTRHLDGNKLNNRASNLKWGTAQENADDRKRHGTVPQGENNHASKLNREQARSVCRRRLAGEPRLVLADEFGISDTAVMKIASGDSWGHATMDLRLDLPWIAEQSDPDVPFSWIVRIAAVGVVASGLTEAQARIMSAAPELADALEMARKYVARKSRDYNTKQIIDALKKADWR